MDLISIFMESPTLQNLIAIALVALSTLISLMFIKTRRLGGPDHKKPPEASGGWPLIGHLHLLAGKVPPHRVLAAMADKYGPIFTIRLGRKPTIIISSWEMVKECYGTNDKVFLERPNKSAVNRSYDGAVYALGPRFGQYWQNMRRISSHELLSHSQLDLLQSDRSSEVKTCIKHLFSLCRAEPAKVVNLSDWSSLVIMNIMTRMVVGSSFDPNGKEWRRFTKSVEDFVNLMGTYVVSDVVPFTEWMDLQGHFKAVKHAVDGIDHFIDKWLKEHVLKRKEGKVDDGDKDFVDVMLSILEKDPSLTHPHSSDICVKGTILSLIFAGVETSATMIAWALTLLVNHPEVLKKTQNEIDTNVGKERWMEESDMGNLPYLTAVLKENLRYSIPLNVIRTAMEDCTIAGYPIPKGTNLITNIWKVQHDPRIWSDPEKFQPERFIPNFAPDYEERDKKFMFLPFSVGRKGCPGPTSAMQTMSLVLGRLLQGFDLAAPDGRKVDMTEGFGLTNPKATPLELIVTPRLAHELYC